MNKIALLFSALSCALCTQASAYYNATELDFYAPDYPGTINLATSSDCSKTPVKCTALPNYIVSCSVTMPEDGQVCSLSTYGTIGFSTSGWASICSYSYYANYQNGAFIIQVTGSSSNNMNCDAAMQSNGTYRINY